MAIWLVWLLWGGGLLFAGLGSWRYGHPAAPSGELPADEFSALRALEAFDRVFPEDTPHPVGSAANAAVRDGIVAELTAQGHTPEIQTHFVCGGFGRCSEVHNVLARVGVAGRPAVLLMAHYDSVPAGPGASDDGAGVAAVLEIARLLPKIRDERWQDVIILLTDGEESGLLGARAFNLHRWARDAWAVVNLEARGTSGATFLFEMRGSSDALVTGFAAHSSAPATNSFAQTVYEAMPNSTDFSAVPQYRGFNFSFFADVHNYHTPQDDRRHLDAGSVQHLGAQAAAALTWLASTPDAQSRIDQGHDAVFFDILAFGVISWPRGATPWLAWLALVGLLLTCGLALRRGSLTVKALGLGMAIWWVSLAAGAGVALGVGWLLRVGGAVGPLLPFPAWPGLGLLASVVSGAAVAAATACWLGVTAGWRGTWFATWLSWAALAVVVAHLAEGASYLLVVPSALAALMAPLVAKKSPGRLAMGWSVLAPGLGAVVLFAPLAPVLLAAVGLVFFSAISVPVLLLATAVLPAYAALERPIGWRWVRTLGLGAVLASVAALAAPVHDDENQQRLNLVYHEHSASAETTAGWHAQAFGEPLPEELARALPWTETLSTVLPWDHPWTSGVEASIEPHGLEAPLLRHEDRPARHENRRQIHIHLRSRRGAQATMVGWPDRSRLIGAEADGTPVHHSDNGDWAGFWVLSTPPEGIRIDLDVMGQEPFTVWVGDRTHGLPEWGAELAAARQGRGIPVQYGDLVVVSEEHTF